MEEIILKNVENTLDTLNKVSIWIFISILVSLVSTSSSDSKIKMGDIEIERRYSGITIFVILCGLNFYSLKLYNSLYSQYFDLLSLNYQNIEYKKATVTKLYVIFRENNWVFNPFSETHTLSSSILDNLGIALNITLWWLGFTLAFRETLIKRSQENINGISYDSKKNLFKLKKYFYYILIVFLYLIYLFLGFKSLKYIIELSRLISNDFIHKSVFAIIGIISGSIMFFWVNRKGIQERASLLLSKIKYK